MPTLRTISLVLVGGTLLASLGSCSEETMGPRKDQGASTDTKPDGKLVPIGDCATPGKPCKLPNPCAINPICGQDYRCRATKLLNCDDKLSCTVDTCTAQGTCRNVPRAGTCVLPVPVTAKPDAGTPDAGAADASVKEGGAGDAKAGDAKMSDANAADAGVYDASVYDGSAGDGGVKTTELKCFKQGQRHPKQPCMVCDPGIAGPDAGWGDVGVSDMGTYYPDLSGPYGDPFAWTAVTGGTCNDGNACTESDTCVSGVCKGNDYSGMCKSPVVCQEVPCDGKGGCLPAKLKSGYCLIMGDCYKDQTPNPDGTCTMCDVKTAQTSWTPIKNACTIGGLCYQNGAKNPAGCGTCDGSKSTSSWTVSASENCCLIGGQAVTKGTKDSSGCMACDPTKSTSSWTPLSNICTINGKCYSSGDKDATGCYYCDPTKSTSSWTPLSTVCIIGGACYQSGDKDPTGCATCDPTKSTTSWTTLPTACLIGGQCYQSGAKDSTGCMVCDPKKSTTAWTQLTNVCLIGGQCYASGATDPTGCATCDPTKSTTSWTTLSTVCVIDAKCLQKGAKNPVGCGECDPATSTTKWTVTGTTCCLINSNSVTAGSKGPDNCSQCNPNKDKYNWSLVPGTCKISGTCYLQGDQILGGCAQCDVTKSTTAWTVIGSNCLIGGVCKKNGDKDPLGCSHCDPTKSTTAWTTIPGMCKIGGACYAKGVKHAGGCAECDPQKSITSWTVTSTGCFIDNTCYTSGAQDATGCATCTPATSKTAWTPGSGYCVIDNTCYFSGSLVTGGCATCSPHKSATSWTITGTGCLIDETCVAKGTKHTAGCGECDPQKSTTAWTVTSSGCLIGEGCYQDKASEPGGCGTCDPAKSATSWTPGSTCLAVHDWSRRYGGTSSDSANGAAVDTSGNIFVVGSFSGTADFGGGSVTSNGSNADIFVASYTSKGNHRWSRTFGDAMSDVANGVAVDSSGNVYVTGYFHDKANFGGGSLTANGGAADVFVASFTNSGAHRWSKSFGSVHNEYANDLTVTSAGNVVVVGYFSDPVNFGGGTLTDHGSNDIFVLNLTSTGAHSWSKSFGGPSSDLPYAVAEDSKGNLYVTGYFNGTVDFGGGNVTASSSDVFLLKLTSAGAYSAVKTYGGSSSDYGYDLAVDSKDNVLLTGYFYNTINFGGSSLYSQGSYDVYVASLTSALAHNWSKAAGQSSSDYGYSVAVDSSDNVYVGGYFNTSINFGGSTISAQGGNDAFVATYDSTGKHRWSRGLGGSSNEYCRSILVDNNKGVVLVGYFQGSADFGGGSLSSKGSNDVFVVRLAQ